MTDPTPQQIPHETPGTTPLPDNDPGPSPQPEIDPSGTPDEMPQFGENDGSAQTQPQHGHGDAPSGPLDPAI